VNPEHAKAVAAAMIGLWESEYPATVRVLSAVPDGGRDYRPDSKSRTAWELVVHLATADVWFVDSIARGAFDFDPAWAKKLEAGFGQVRDVVAFYEATFPAKLSGLLNLPGASMIEVVDFFGMMQRSRAEWIGFASNHSVHHRGQLSAYLRSMGSKVPDIYGPSGDAEPAAN
jgi:uncharacterized damage-inducible protein DinB